MTLEPALDRRSFVRRALGTSAAAVSARVAARWRMLAPSAWAGREIAIGAHGHAPATFRIALALLESTPDDSRGARAVAACGSGAELGVDEARHAAGLLGASFTQVATVATLADARALLSAEPLSAVVCAAGARETSELGSEAARLGVVLINALASDDGLRNAQCARSTFHVAASDAMRTDALRAAMAMRDGVSPGARAAEWDAQLERFGAAQLNDRFAARFTKPMDASAWAGWFAVKVAWEASQRARAADGGSIAAYLERETSAFDGHKGVALSFRAWDHQLRQPLYVVAATALSDGSQPQPSRASMPVAVPGSPAPSRAALDSLGTSQSGTTCRWR